MRFFDMIDMIDKIDMIGARQWNRRSAAMEGECPHEPPSAHSAEGKRCRDPRTARLLSPHWYKHPHAPVGKLAGGPQRPRKANLINRTGGADGFLFATFSFMSFSPGWPTAGPLGYVLPGRTFNCPAQGANPFLETKGAPSNLFRHDPSWLDWAGGCGRPDP